MFFVAAIAVWCTPGFATVQNLSSSGLIDSNGQASGVYTTGLVTLEVPDAENIFNANNAGGGTLATSTAYAVESSATSQGSILFDGSSNVYGVISSSTGGAILDIRANGGASAAVNLYGTVIATTMEVGAGTVNFASGTNSNAVAPTFTAAAGTTGTISLAANTQLHGTILTLTNDQGILSLNNGSEVVGAVGGPAAAAGLYAINLPGPTTGVGFSSTITGAVNAYNFNLGINTLNVGGALTIADNSGAGVIATSVASPSLYGNIKAPVGPVNLVGTSSLLVNMNVLPSLVDIPKGTTFDIITSSGGDSHIVSIVSNNSAIPSTGTVTTGQLVITTTADIPAVVSLPPSAAPVAQVILNIPDPSPVIAQVQAAILALAASDPVAAVDAVTQLGPSSPSLAAPQVTFQGAREFQDLWESHLEMCSQAGSADEESCKGTNLNNGVWVKGFGYFGSQDDRDGYSGYDSTIFGTMVAYDVPIGEDTRAGLGFGYAHTTIDGHTYNNNTEFDTFQPTVYIGHEQGPWFVHGSGSVGFNQYDGRRNIVFPGVDSTAKSEYNGEDYTAYVNGGYNFSAPLKSTITPIVSLQYTRVNMDSYTENGASDIDLHAKPQGYDFLESGLGVKVERDFSVRNWQLVPEIHAEWLHDFLNPTMAQTAQFQTTGASPFYVTGLKTDPDTLHAGTSLSLLSCTCSKTKLSLEAGYDFYWRNDGYIANQVTLRITGRF